MASVDHIASAASLCGPGPGASFSNALLAPPPSVTPSPPRTFEKSRNVILGTLSQLVFAQVTFVRSREVSKLDEHDVANYFFGFADVVEDTLTDGRRGSAFFDKNTRTRRGFAVGPAIIPDTHQSCPGLIGGSFVDGIPKRRAIIFGTMAPTTRGAGAGTDTGTETKSGHRKCEYKMTRWNGNGTALYAFYKAMQGGKLRLKALRREMALHLLAIPPMFAFPKNAGPPRCGKDDLYAIFILVLLGRVHVFAEDAAREPSKRELQLSVDDPMHFALSVARATGDDTLREAILAAAPEGWTEHPAEHPRRLATDPRRRAEWRAADFESAYLETVKCEPRDVWNAGTLQRYEKEEQELEEEGAAADPDPDTTTHAATRWGPPLPATDTMPYEDEDDSFLPPPEPEPATTSVDPTAGAGAGEDGWVPSSPIDDLPTGLYNPASPTAGTYTGYDPSHPGFDDAPPPPPPASPPPSSWQEVTASSGRVYWFCTLTGESRWDNPHTTTLQFTTRHNAASIMFEDPSLPPGTYDTL